MGLEGLHSAARKRRENLDDRCVGDRLIRSDVGADAIDEDEADLEESPHAVTVLCADHSEQLHE